MKIKKAKNCGFCFGVRRAIKVAQDTAKKHNNVYIRGDLVHNEQVCQEIKKLGIKNVKNLKQIPNNSTIIIKAHGEPLATYLKAKAKKLKVIDATCPMVKDIHTKASNLEKKKYQIVVIGDPNHEETLGIIGSLKNGLIIKDSSQVNRLKEKLRKKVAVVCQSTQNIEKVSAIVSELIIITEELLFINTICQPTRMRQSEIEKLASKSKAILVVGSKKSANTKRLYDLSKKINKNSFLISDPGKFKKQEFMKFESIGIIGGASTSQEVLDQIHKELI